jgi:hypothetical protein
VECRGLLGVGGLLLHLELLVVMVDWQRGLVSRTSYWACNRRLTSVRRTWRGLAGERVDGGLGAVRLEPGGFPEHCSVGKPELCLRSCRRGRGMRGGAMTMASAKDAGEGAAS